MKRLVVKPELARALVLIALLALPMLGAYAAENATITGDGVRIREEARTDAPIVTTLDKGARITVINRTGITQTINGDFSYWYYVTAGDQSGFVFGRFIAIDPAAAPSFVPVIAPIGPKFPYEDWGACPFECCTYREWSVKKDTMIRTDRYNTAPAAFTVKAGEWVTGITGVVITTLPGRAEIKTPMNLGSRPAVPGDVVEMLTYQGEGFYRAWFKGQLLDSVEGYGDIVMTVEPVSTWWAQIKNKKGQPGWTDETENFGHMDGCGQ